MLRRRQEPKPVVCVRQTGFVRGRALERKLVRDEHSNSSGALASSTSRPLALLAPHTRSNAHTTLAAAASAKGLELTPHEHKLCRIRTGRVSASSRRGDSDRPCTSDAAATVGIASPPHRVARTASPRYTYQVPCLRVRLC
mmetsp:Transcript_7830/g.24659  ORF Transcript_7830/g.24659 Transcript_7830/m.24659 type:complete len:141 (-) Transcript_7830:565-987(-)